MAHWVKENTCNTGDAGDVGSLPGSGRSPEGGNWKQLTAVFLPGESHGQRSLTGYGPSAPKELDTTEATERARMHIGKDFNFLLKVIQHRHKSV